jgi:hypothetical protein
VFAGQLLGPIAFTSFCGPSAGVVIRVPVQVAIQLSHSFRNE